MKVKFLRYEKSLTHELNHVEIVTSHKLDAHRFPVVRPVGVSIPRNGTHLTFIVDCSGGGFTRFNVRASQERRCQDGDERES